MYGPITERLTSLKTAKVEYQWPIHRTPGIWLCTALIEEWSISPFCSKWCECGCHEPSELFNASRHLCKHNNEKPCIIKTSKPTDQFHWHDMSYVYCHQILNRSRKSLKLYYFPTKYIRIQSTIKRQSLTFLFHWLKAFNSGTRFTTALFCRSTWRHCTS